MPNVQIAYGGEYYTITDRAIDDVQQQIDEIVASGAHGWLEALDGHGSREPYRLLITAYAQLSLTIIPVGADTGDDGDQVAFAE